MDVIALQIASSRLLQSTLRTEYETLPVRGLGYKWQGDVDDGKEVGYTTVLDLQPLHIGGADLVMDGCPRILGSERCCNRPHALRSLTSTKGRSFELNSAEMARSSTG